MTHTLRLRADAAPASIQATLGQARAGEIALVFPLGQRVRLAVPSALDQLALAARQAGVRVTIVGGDETLRALAVAAGFVVATTLEDDDARVTRARAHSRPRERWEDAYARFAVRRSTRDSQPLTYEETVTDYLVDEPPAYLRTLLAQNGFALPTADEPYQPVRLSGRATRKLAAIEEEQSFRDAYESAEESVTTRIRTTGGPAPSAPAPQSHLS